MLRSQMLSPIAPASLTGLRQLADKMEKILLVALDTYGNTFVEPKVELGARFGHLVCEWLSRPELAITVTERTISSALPGHLPGHTGAQHGVDEPKAAFGDEAVLAED